MEPLTLRYTDNASPVQYGDIVYICSLDRKYVTVDQDGETISFEDFENDGLKQKLLVCGNPNFSGKFYLTFKNSRGFLYYDGQILKSGVPWTEKSLFTEDLLKESLHQQVLQIYVAAVNESE